MASSSSHEMRRKFVTTRRRRQPVADLHEAVSRSPSPVRSPRDPDRRPNFAWHELYEAGELDTYVEEDEFDTFAAAEASKNQLFEAALRTESEEECSGERDSEADEDAFDLFDKAQAASEQIFDPPFHSASVDRAVSLELAEESTAPVDDVEDLTEIRERVAGQQNKADWLHASAYGSLDDADAVPGARGADDGKALSMQAMRGSDPYDSELALPVGKEDVVANAVAVATENWGKHDQAARSDMVAAQHSRGEDVFASAFEADAALCGQCVDEEELAEESSAHGDDVKDLAEIRERVAGQQTKADWLHVSAYGSLDDADAVHGARGADAGKSLSMQALRGSDPFDSELALPVDKEDVVANAVAVVTESWGKHDQDARSDMVVAQRSGGEGVLASASEADAELCGQFVDEEESRRRQDKGAWLRFLGTLCDRVCMPSWLA